jgi:hypothetical protein
MGGTQANVLSELLSYEKASVEKLYCYEHVVLLIQRLQRYSDRILFS